MSFPLFLHTLADAAPAALDTQISGAWVLELVAKIFAGLGVLFTAVWLAFKKGQATPAMETTIKAPVPTVTVREEDDFVTRSELSDHMERIEGSIKELKGDRDRASALARDSVTKIYARLNENTEAVAALGGKVEGINENVGRLVDIAMARPVGTTLANQKKRAGQ